MRDVADLIARAETVRDEQAYQPYSEYAVGAAVETASGEVFIGCNVENAAYSGTIHAEMTAIVSALAHGHGEFDQLAIVSDARDGVPPCGNCRQFLYEFVDDDFPIYSATDDGYTEWTMGELLPGAFGPGDVLSEPPQ